MRMTSSWRPSAREARTSMEGVLVSAKPLSLTRQRWRRSLAVARAGSAAMPIAKELVATEGVRGQAACSAAADNAVAERRRVGELRSKLHQDHAVLVQAGKARKGPRLEGCGNAEAGGSPSSEAPPEGSSRMPKEAQACSGRRRGARRTLERYAVERQRGGKGSAIGNRAACRVLVSRVGCRRRGDASFSPAR